ncbi:MAG: type IV pilus assembly protein FimV [Pseudomonadales bacterium]
MSESILWIVGISAIALIALLLFSRSSTTKHGEQKDSSASDVLEEVKIFQAYGRTDQAIERLESGLVAFPDSIELQTKLEELKQ